MRSARPYAARPRRRIGGCLLPLILGLLASGLVYLAVLAVFAPWGYFLGGSFHPLAYWQGWGTMRTASGQEYVLEVWMWPASSRYVSAVRGSAKLCTPRGERINMKLLGNFYARIGKNSDGERMHLWMSPYVWTWKYVSFAHQNPRLEFMGQWHGAELSGDDHGTVARNFLVDGTVYSGPPSKQPPSGTPLHITLKEGSDADFTSACASAAH